MKHDPKFCLQPLVLALFFNLILNQHVNNRTFLSEFISTLENYQNENRPPNPESELDREPPKYEDLHKSEQIALDDIESMDLPTYSEINSVRDENADNSGNQSSKGDASGNSESNIHQNQTTSINIDK